MVSAFPEHIVLPTPLDLTFEGFAPEAFAILERLQQEPHIEQYRKEKEANGRGERSVKQVFTEPMDKVPEDLRKAEALWVRRCFERESVLAWEGHLVMHALEAIHQLWPLYRFLLEGKGKMNGEKG